MYRSTILLLISVLSTSFFNTAIAGGVAPWGQALISETTYQQQKVVYDLDVNSEKKLSNILHRLSYLSKLNDNDPFEHKIIVVIHGDAIPFFAIKHTKEYNALMERAYSQTSNETIEFRMCRASARLRGFKAKDIHGFITMIPMADAEIIRLQKAGYAYMR